ncbi:MAG: hypothetical protein K2Q18_01585 [Bdellovibrionales bacterium]|nr:hypothetical protein [Bdellovibrionales bacterium]
MNRLIGLMTLKFLLVISLTLVISPLVRAAILSPNYDFTMKTLEPFFPGGSLEKLKSDKTITSDIFEDNGNHKIFKVRLKKTNYALDIFIQTMDDKITDMFVRMPQHFNHDLFLTELQKTYKKQDKYVRKDLSALYVWKERDGNNILYHGSCSISCFPMFIEVVSIEKSVVPLYQKFNEALPIW